MPTLPRLLANRAFDIIVQRSVARKLDSSAEIAAEIQNRAEDFSIGDWWTIAMAMKPKILWATIITSGLIIVGAFGLGWNMSGASQQVTEPVVAPSQSQPPITSATTPAATDNQSGKTITHD